MIKHWREPIWIDVLESTDTMTMKTPLQLIHTSKTIVARAFWRLFCQKSAMSADVGNLSYNVFQTRLQREFQTHNNSHKTLPISTYCDGHVGMPHWLRYIDDWSTSGQRVCRIMVSKPVTAYHRLIYRFCQTFYARRDGLRMHRFSFEAFPVRWKQPFTTQRSRITIQGRAYRCFQHDFPMFVAFGVINA